MLNAIIELKAIKVLYKDLRSTCECNQALVAYIDWHDPEHTLTGRTPPPPGSEVHSTYIYIYLSDTTSLIASSVEIFNSFAKFTASVVPCRTFQLVRLISINLHYYTIWLKMSEFWFSLSLSIVFILTKQSIAKIGFKFLNSWRCWRWF